MAIIKTGNKIGVGGLHGRLAAKQMLDASREAIPVDQMPHRLVIVADLSGSMNEPADRSARWDSGAKSKLEYLKDGIQDFALRSDNTTTALAVESFPEGFRVNLTTNSNEVMLRMFGAGTLGDTPMGIGLSNGLSVHSPTRAMLISDGDATDGDESYTAARRYREREICIDCVHIGYSSSGEERLKKIAEMTGGMYLKFKSTTNFAEAFHYLLPESRDAIAGMLPYDRERLLGADESK